MVVGRRSASGHHATTPEPSGCWDWELPGAWAWQWQVPKSGARSGPVHAVKQSAIINIQDKRARGREHASKKPQAQLGCGRPAAHRRARPDPGRWWATRCSRTQLDLMGHDPQPVSR